MNKISILVLVLISAFSCKNAEIKEKNQLVIKESLGIKNKTNLQLKSETIQNDDDNVSAISTKSIEKFTVKELRNFIVGNYTNDEEGSHCKFKLTLCVKNEKLKYYIETEKRKISGIAKMSIEENGFIFIIFPIEWDDYQGDMTQNNYEKYTVEKPQQFDMSFDIEEKTLYFQNYGNAMNNYIIFDECDEKGISLKMK
ncbi:hypothetical protein [Flavobacterium weaverense]|uniref:Lipoprotein n=1 Tax=Flavobacterium weaverense TaxID=271156 RepID=A0A3L9ZQC1_9FLAO|nr:hypothetical protein [Flavobacterium weaverense]RMA72558.1 hypothetical protein BC961_2961 [Flavobacterium weaverense]